MIDKILRAAIERLRASTEREARLREALTGLRNEVGATLSFGGSLREAIGNTNYACLEHAHGIANAALSQPEEGKQT